MTFWTKSIKFLAASTLVLGACGDDDDNGNNNTPDATTTPTIDAGVTPDATPDATPLTGVDAICAENGALPLLFNKSATCNPGFGFLTVLGTDLLGYQYLEDICRGNINSELSTGDVTIDDSKIGACIDFVNAANCVELDIDNLVNTPCEEIFVGTVATDGECEVASQCAGDAFCRQEEVCGTCQPRIAAGELCDNNESCSDGKCNSAGVCAAPVGLGGACVGSLDCGGILGCNPVTNVCALPFPEQGDVCVSDEECGDYETSMYCQRPQLSGGPPAQGTCQPLPSVGESCVPVDILGGTPGCDFLAYEWCNMGTCAAPLASVVGEDCHVFATETAGAKKCASGLLCANVFGPPGSVGTCRTPGEEGDACESESMNPTQVCHPFYQCDGSTDLCTLDLDVTGMCTPI